MHGVMRMSFRVGRRREGVTGGDCQYIPTASIERTPVKDFLLRFSIFLLSDLNQYWKIKIINSFSV